MPFYSVRLVYDIQRKPLGNKPRDWINLTKTELVKGIVEPYLKGSEFLFAGEMVKPSEVAGFAICETFSDVSSFTSAMRLGEDVSDYFLGIPENKGRQTHKNVAASSKNVFIVHGRDLEPMKELKAMLYEFGLNPIILHEQPSGSRTIVEKLEHHSDVGYAFVILTPDDVGEEWGGFVDGMSEAWEELLKTFGQAMKSQEENEIEYQTGSIEELQSRKGYELSVSMLVLKECLKRRSRQNVVLEFGYFIGLLDRDRVCCLHQGNVELPSDMHGIVYIPFKESVNEARNMIEKELREAGYEIKK